MKVAADAPKRPALRFYGSQWNNAPWILKHWPKHETRVIPFMGGLNEELRAPIAKVTNAADLDGRIINFFQVLRNRTDELVQALLLTPWHEGEYLISQFADPDPLEDARRFWCACWMSVSGGPVPAKSGFRWVKDRQGRFTTPASDSLNISHLYDVAMRIRHIEFLQRDGLRLIEDSADVESCLIWCDPPFVKSTRSNGAGAYAHETSETLHQDLADVLQTVSGYALVTGYGWNDDGTKNKLYEDLYERRGWARIDSERRVNGGGTRVQSLWLSSRTYDAIFNQHADLPIFTGGPQ